MLRALWALFSIEGTDNSFLLRLLDVKNENVRAWAVRLLADNAKGIEQDVKDRLAELATVEKSGLVRLYMASALNHFDLEADYGIYQALTGNVNEKTDRMLPKLIWYRLEPRIIPHRHAAIRLIVDSKFPLIRENISRRIVSELDSDSSAVGDLVKLLSASRLEVVSNVAYGMKLALEGRTKVQKPLGWDEVYARVMERNSTNERQNLMIKAIKEHMQDLNVVFGDGQGIAELKKIATDPMAAVTSRRNAIKEYAATKPNDLFEFLKPLVSNKSLSNAVVESMVLSERQEIANIVINRYGHLDPVGKKIAINTLTSRKSWAHRLLDAVQKNRIPKPAITALHARQLANFDDASLTAKLSKIWGSTRESDASKIAEMERIRLLCSNDEDLTFSGRQERYRIGQKLFVQKCATCHVIYGSGSNVGPDLTGGGRKNLNYLLENIVDPNASVADSYRSTKFVLGDGRFLTGVVLERTQQTTRIQTASEVAIVENRNIDESKLTKLSLMPEGLLKNMTDVEIQSLFYFLRSDRQ